MNMTSVGIGCLLFLNACVTPPPKQYVGEMLTSPPDFPLGKYVHAVDVDVPGRGNWQMQGVVHMTESGVNLAGLSPMGTTVFKIIDDYSTNTAEVTVYQPEVKKYEAKLLEFYMQLRPHLAGRKVADAASLPPDWKVRYFANKKSDRLPPTLTVSSPRFSIAVEVVQYEP